MLKAQLETVSHLSDWVGATEQSWGHEHVDIERINFACKWWDEFDRQNFGYGCVLPTAFPEGVAAAEH